MPSTSSTVGDITDGRRAAAGLRRRRRPWSATCAARRTSTSTGSGSTSSTSPTRAPCSRPTAGLGDEDRAEIDRRLDRLDRASRHGPWTRDTLRLIERDARGPRRGPGRRGRAASGCRSRPTCASSRTSVSRSASAWATSSAPAARPTSTRPSARHLDARGRGRAPSAGDSPARPASQQAIGAAVRSDACAATPARSRSDRRSVSSSGGSMPEASRERGDPLGCGCGHRRASAATLRWPMAEDPGRCGCRRPS